MLPFLGGLRRRDFVTAQFATGQQAQAYVDAHGLAGIDGRHRAARIELLHELLAPFPKGMLLDAGCGPGVLARSLLRSPSYDYQITMLDQSEAMIRYCVAHSDRDKEQALVGELEHLPFNDASFDVTVCTGALEYTHASNAVVQLSRVTRPGGMVVISMLNPLSPYWLTDWFLYRPAARVVSWTTRTLNISARRTQARKRSGIRAVRSGMLGRYLRRAGLVPVDFVYFGPMPLVRPFDKIPALRRWCDRHSGQRITANGWRRWMATGYVIVAQRQ
jgi:ubiquinone/menaquinone biosynthesis C-methylase UbiE